MSILKRKNPESGEIWRHFKNRYYRILGVAKHTETNEPLVIYKRYEFNKPDIYARPLEMFMSPIDKEKYPHSPDLFRFNHVPEGIPLTSAFIEEG